MSERNPRIHSFACRVAGCPEFGETIYNATSRGRAKREHHLQVSEPWPGVKFTDIRVRKLGAAHTSEAFRRTAEYRGLPNLRCGHEVRVGLSQGAVLGHNSSANFDVLFHAGPYAGQTLSVHPQELEILSVSARAA